MENLYATLNSADTATYDELKRAYQDLALKYHPDKCQGSKQSAEMFVKINKAWKILCNPVSRKNFDECWQQRRLVQDFAIHETVDFEEFRHEEFPVVDSSELCIKKQSIYYYGPCKCGMEFILDQREVDVRLDIVCCDWCSLAIKVVHPNNM